MKQEQEHDMLDYDGMGNYGRFPPTDDRKSVSKISDIMIIVVVMSIPIVYIILK